MSYVVAAWLIVSATLGLYAIATVVRGRRLARQVPTDRQRWLS